MKNTLFLSFILIPSIVLAQQGTTGGIIHGQGGGGMPVASPTEVAAGISSNKVVTPYGLANGGVTVGLNPAEVGSQIASSNNNPASIFAGTATTATKLVPNASVTSITPANGVTTNNGNIFLAGQLITTNVPIYSSTGTNTDALVLNGAGAGIVNGIYYNNGSRTFTNSGNVVLITNTVSPKLIVTNTSTGDFYYLKNNSFTMPFQTSSGTSVNWAPPNPWCNFLITNTTQSGTTPATVLTLPNRFMLNTNVYFISPYGNDQIGSPGRIAFKSLSSAITNAALNGGTNLFVFDSGYFSGNGNNGQPAGIPAHSSLIGAEDGSSIITNILTLASDTRVINLTVSNASTAVIQDGNTPAYPVAGYGSSSNMFVSYPMYLQNVYVYGNVDGLIITTSTRGYAVNCTFGSLWDGFFISTTLANWRFINCNFYQNFDFTAVSNNLVGVVSGFTGTGLEIAGVSNSVTFDQCFITSSNGPAAPWGGAGTSARGSYGIKIDSATGPNYVYLHGCTILTGSTNSGANTYSILFTTNSAAAGASYNGTWWNSTNLVSTMVLTNIANNLTNAL